MTWRILPASGHRRMRWANGGGWTTEIVAWPSVDAWQWRVSVADVAVEGPFSSFPGVDRTIALLAGNGFTLRCGDGPPAVVDEPFVPFRFAGDVSTTCHLLDGPVQDLNLMVRRGSAGRGLRFVRVDGRTVLPSMVLAVVVSGALRVGSDELGRLDAFGPATSQPAVTVDRVGGAPSVVAVVTETPDRGAQPCESSSTSS